MSRPTQAHAGQRGDQAADGPRASAPFRGYRIDAAGLALCLLLTFGAFAAGVKPMLDRSEEAASLRDQIAQQREQAAQLGDLATRLRRALGEVRQAAERDRIDLEPTARVNRRVAEVAELAGSVGVRIDEVQPGEPVRGERYHTVPIRIAGSGRYPGAAAFLHRLRQVSPDIAVASVELLGRPQNADAPADLRFGLIWHAAPESSP